MRIGHISSVLGSELGTLEISFHIQLSFFQTKDRSMNPFSFIKKPQKPSLQNRLQTLNRKNDTSVLRESNRLMGTTGLIGLDQIYILYCGMRDKPFLHTTQNPSGRTPVGRRLLIFRISYSIRPSKYLHPSSFWSFFHYCFKPIILKNSCVRDFTKIFSKTKSVLVVHKAQQIAARITTLRFSFFYLFLSSAPTIARKSSKTPGIVSHPQTTLTTNQENTRTGQLK